MRPHSRISEILLSLSVSVVTWEQVTLSTCFRGQVMQIHFCFVAFQGEKFTVLIFPVFGSTCFRVSGFECRGILQIYYDSFETHILRITDFHNDSVDALPLSNGSSQDKTGQSATNTTSVICAILLSQFSAKPLKYAGQLRGLQYSILPHTSQLPTVQQSNHINGFVKRKQLLMRTSCSRSTLPLVCCWQG